MPGRKPIADVIKIARGTLRKCRQKKNPPQADGIPRCPFAVSSIAGRKWREVVDGLVRLGLIDKIDATHVEGLCRNYQMAKEADKVLEKEGFVVLGSMGSPMKHPCASVSDAAWGKVRAYCNDLGLNHLSRQRMSSTRPAEETDKESKYLA